MADTKLVKKSNPLQLRLAERRFLLVIGDFLMAVIAVIAALVFWGSTLRFIDFNLAFLRDRVPVWFYFLPFIWVLLLTENLRYSQCRKLEADITRCFLCRIDRTRTISGCLYSLCRATALGIASFGSRQLFSAGGYFNVSLASALYSHFYCAGLYAKYFVSGGWENRPNYAPDYQWP